MMDFGHSRETTFFLAQTNCRRFGSASSCATQAQFLTFTRPLDRQVSHFHAAGEEN
jgi:hypothetical protein